MFFDKKKSLLTNCGITNVPFQILVQVHVFNHVIYVQLHALSFISFSQFIVTVQLFDKIIQLEVFVFKSKLHEKDVLLYLVSLVIVSVDTLSILVLLIPGAIKLPSTIVSLY